MACNIVGFNFISTETSVQPHRHAVTVKAGHRDQSSPLKWSIKLIIGGFKDQWIQLKTCPDNRAALND